MRSILAAILSAALLGLASCAAPSSNNMAPQPTSTGSSSEYSAENADFPVFKLPAPSPSAKVELSWTALGTGLTTVGAVEARLRAQLDSKGYTRRSYYSVPGGFAVATQAERFERDGRSTIGDRRWKLDPTGLIGMPATFTVAGILESLRNAGPGRYRVIVILVTTKLKTTDGSATSIGQAQAWVGNGGDGIPLDVAKIPLGQEHRMTALIYEFARVAVQSDIKFVGASPLDGRAHLVGAGLLRRGS
ncbi:hypothetical protein P1X14_11520 [Sphingomonas sp. AOB5]|uniref:hypothetical protein n=1 Tax=Sphingomonas sp. AOB5 TaxID=3034017 RepID=UPI0023FA0D94|nr:hypothetical protein [Sphingomonas sp. AOB5]MDF7775877.1 hypothetical protein [Sphingomonas sp. AOB5]